MIQVEGSEGIYVKNMWIDMETYNNWWIIQWKTKYNDSELINSYRKAYVTDVYKRQVLALSSKEG